MLTSVDIEFFAVIAESPSLAAAARLLDVTPPGKRPIPLLVMENYGRGRSLAFWISITRRTVSPAR